MEASSNSIPKHVGIILDGNRRFAKKLMLKPWKGHEFGAEKVKKLLEWAKDVGIKELTLYAFSYENFNRPKKEFDYLMYLFRKEFDNLIDNKDISKNKIKISFLGRLYLFPKDIQERMYRIMDKTKNNDKYIVNFAMAYGGRAEIVDAVKRIGEKIKEENLDVKSINEKLFNDNLYMGDDADLIIRTGGEKRTSGFLPWQGTYAELIFVDKSLPEFEKEDFLQCIKEFQSRKRRFGK